MKTRSPFSRWDVGEAPAGGVGMPWVEDYWGSHLGSDYLGVRRFHDPQFAGTLWAATFDLRWQFLAMHRYMVFANDPGVWHVMVPDDAVHKAWEVAHGDDRMLLAERRAYWKDSAQWYAGELLRNPEFMEARFERSPLWEMMPLEEWEPILTEVAAGNWTVSPEERVRGLRWGIMRQGIPYPQKIGGTDVDDVLVACGRALDAGRLVGGVEYADLPDAWAETDTARLGAPEARRASWLVEVRKTLTQKRYSRWFGAGSPGFLA